MPTLKDQLLLEDDLLIQGVTRYTKIVQSAEEKGRSADTGYGSKLMKHLIAPVSESIREFCSGGARKHGKYKVLLDKMDAESVAYIGLKTVLNQLHKTPTATAICLKIGVNLEDEQRFSFFREMNPEYYAAVMKDFSRKRTKAYRHMRNVMSVAANKKGAEWESWNKEVKLAVGSIVLDCILEATDLIYINKKRVGTSKKYTFQIVPTQSAIEWIEKYNNHASLLHPYTKPCIIEPDDWVDINNGGYYSEAMRKRNPLIKGLGSKEAAFVSDHAMPEVLSAVNAIQRTPWVVNTKVLGVMQQVWSKNLGIGLPKKEPIDIPKFRVDTPAKEMDEATFNEFLRWKAEVSQLYTDETSRSSKAFDTARTLNMAQSYSKYDSLWFVNQCDFRGRVYASTAGISPQGADFSKALLQFQEGKVLGNGGLYWLAVHGANCYGIDKVSFDDRVAWIVDRVEQIQEVAQDPLAHTGFWGEADSPYMFLAFCFEFAEGCYEPDQFITHLPVGMDGSCNGLQHFSALLQDEVGGKATNLINGDAPRDIYKEVAAATLERIKSNEDSEQKDLWMQFAEKHGGIPRKLAKRPVMTLPYGSTKFSCLKFVQEALQEVDPEYFPDFNAACAYLNDNMWESIGSVVIAARNAMDWLREVARVSCDNQIPVWWVNPAGFPVYQANMKTSSKQIRTALMGNTRLRLLTKEPTLAKDKQTQGISPNFVHSLDSAHMMLTVNEATKRGITSFAMIHDDFGTHACDVELFREIIRESFVVMYKDNDPLQDLYTTTAMSIPTDTIPPVPDTGNLDLNEVLDSEYFFA